MKPPQNLKDWELKMQLSGRALALHIQNPHLTKKKKVRKCVEKQNSGAELQYSPEISEHSLLLLTARQTTPSFFILQKEQLSLCCLDLRLQVLRL